MNTFKLVKNHSDKFIPIFLSFFKPGNFQVLIRNLLSSLHGPVWEDFINKNNLTYCELIERALQWIKRSQDIVGSGGVGCYEFYRWTKGYPEVTGYIIPTFLGSLSFA